MAESVLEEPKAAIPEMPTRITAAQVIAGLLVLLACRYAQGVLAPLLVAILAAVALAPLVRVMATLMPRWFASAIVVICLAAAVGGTAYLLSDEVTAFSRRLPDLIRETRTIVQSISPRQGLVRQLQQAMNELETSTKPAAPGNATPVTIVDPVDVQREMMAGARSIGAYLTTGIMLLFLIYFLLESGDLFKQKFVKLSGERLSQRRVTVQMIDEIMKKIGSFVFYIFWSGLLVGVTTWVAFAWMGVRYAGLWGVAAGVLNCIPYFGPTLIMFASAAAALIQFRDPAMVALVAGVSLLITSLEGFLLAPLMLGQAARVNSVAVFVAIMFWGWMWGGIGMLVAVPLLMIIKTIADHVESLSGLSELLADRRNGKS